MQKTTTNIAATYRTHHAYALCSHGIEEEGVRQHKSAGCLQPAKWGETYADMKRVGLNALKQNRGEAHNPPLPHPEFCIKERVTDRLNKMVVYTRGIEQYKASLILYRRDEQNR